MKILVTGAEGQLGKHLVTLLSNDHVVASGTRSYLDITNERQTLAEVSRIRPDWVIHCAALTNVEQAESEPDLAFGVNSQGTENVTAACHSVGAKLVYVSTDFVFDGSSPVPYHENIKPNPQTVYGKSKYEGELRVANLLPATDYLIIRIGWVYSTHGNNFMQSILRQAQLYLSSEKSKTNPIRVVVDEYGSPTHAHDIAKQLNAILASDLRGVVHVAALGEATRYQFAEAILEAAGLDVPLQGVTSAEFGSRAPRPKRSSLECRRLKEEKLVDMPSWRQAIMDCLNQRTNARLV